LRLALNRLGEDSSWDLDALKLEFGDVIEISSDIDLTVSGFEMGEIDVALGGAIDDEDALPFVNESILECRDSATSGVSVIIGCSAPTPSRRKAKLACADGVDDDLVNLRVWNKTNAGMGSLYRSKHELIFVYRKRKGRHINNMALGRFGRHRSNV
jgi:hypothetical protein